MSKQRLNASDFYAKGSPLDIEERAREAEIASRQPKTVHITDLLAGHLLDRLHGDERRYDLLAGADDATVRGMATLIRDLIRKDIGELADALTAARLRAELSGGGL